MKIRYALLISTLTLFLGLCGGYCYGYDADVRGDLKAYLALFHEALAVCEVVDNFEMCPVRPESKPL